MKKVVLCFEIWRKAKNFFVETSFCSHLEATVLLLCFWLSFDSARCTSMRKLIVNKASLGAVNR
jgi:hypothetical protein